MGFTQVVVRGQTAKMPVSFLDMERNVRYFGKMMQGYFYGFPKAIFISGHQLFSTVECPWNWNILTLLLQCQFQKKKEQDFKESSQELLPASLCRL